MRRPRRSRTASSRAGTGRRAWATSRSGRGTSSGRRDGSLRERRAWRVYQDLLADPDAGEVAGDGLIPVASALLPGVPHLVLDDADHGMRPGHDWYGSDRFLDAWWPMAVDAWRAALLARARAAAGWDD